VIRHRQPAEPEEPPLGALVAVRLLAGWGVEPAEGPGDSRGFLELLQGRHPRVAALWRQHEPWLRAEARRRQIEPDWGPVDGPPMFYAEWVAVRLSAGARLRRGYLVPDDNGN
jgi:hypothetical protein